MQVMDCEKNCPVTFNEKNSTILVPKKNVFIFSYIIWKSVWKSKAPIICSLSIDIGRSKTDTYYFEEFLNQNTF